MNRKLFVALLVLPAVLVSSALAWVPSTVSSSLTQTKWAGGSVSYRYNASHGSNITGTNTDVTNVVLNSFAQWQQVSNTSLTINNLGTTAITQKSSSDGVNAVLFQDSASQGLIGGALAVTFTSFNASTGTFADADIIFNMSQPFAAGPVTSGRFDLESVLTHEIGHLLGLDHTDVLSATMFQSTPFAVDSQRTLSADDIAGLRATYPGTTPTGAVSGRVTKNSVGVLGAAVFLLDSHGVIAGGGVTTDSQGNFTIHGLEPGTYSLGIEPLDGPMVQGNLGGFFQTVGVFDDNFMTREPSGSFVVTAGNTTNAGTLAVTALVSSMNPTQLVGLTEAGATSFSYGSQVVILAGTTGKQLLVVHTDGVTASTQVSITGSDVTLGTAVSGQFTGGPSFRRFPLTVPGTIPPGGRAIVFKNSSTDVAVMPGAFDVTGGQIAPPNTPPTANAGPDQTDLVLGATVHLIGSATDPDAGDALTYSWTQTSGASVTLVGAGTRTPSFTADSRGTFTFTLTVSDGNATGTDSVNVTVVNRPPTADAGSGQTVTAGDLVTLSGSGLDLDGDSLTYSWTLTSGPLATLSNTAIFNPTFTPASAGTYVFGLTVNDGLASSFASSVTITVDPANLAPVANAGPDQTQTGSTLVTLDGRGSSDPDGNPITYLWEQFAGPTVSLSGATFDVASFTPPEVGVYTFRLTVSDGALTRTDTVTITRQSLPPAASISGSLATTAGQTVSLSGAGSSDPDGETLTYFWRQLEGPFLRLTQTSQATLSFTTSTPGAYGLQLTVTDPEGLTATAQVTVTLTRPAVTPTADAGADRSVALGSQVVLDGRASFDPYLRPLTYRWQQNTGPDTLTLVSETAARASFTTTIAGAYELQLTVTNPDGLSSTDRVLFTAQALTPTSATLTLDAGLNLVSLPVQPETTDGADFTGLQLATLLRSPYIVRIVPGSGTSTRFQVLVPVLDATRDFPVRGGEGYVVSVPAAGPVTYSGVDWPATARDLPVQAGANLIGLPGPVSATFDAEALAAAAGGGSVIEHVDGMGGATSSWRVFVEGLTATSFALTPGKAYLVPAPAGRLPINLPAP
jgi:hypothetical protein